MKISETEIAGFLEILGQSPHRVRSASKGIPLARLHARTAEEPWSANDVLAHLRSCADMWGGSIQAMLAQENPTLPDVHPRKWIKQTNYPEMDFRRSLEAYSNQRGKLLRTLRKLSSEDWPRGAMIGGRRHTVISQVRRMAKHESEHCEQVGVLLK